MWSKGNETAGVGTVKEEEIKRKIGEQTRRREKSYDYLLYSYYCFIDWSKTP